MPLALVIAGTHSGVGKTTVALGTMAAVRRRGLVVQAFKVGPDFIDPSHHARVTGRPAANLDGWMLDRAANEAIAARRAADVDVAVVEGVMGLFDGYDGRSEAGSTAQIAKWLGAPVVLVVDAWALSRSAAALIQGFAGFDPDLQMAGVILNRIAGEDHLRWIREAVEPAIAVPILGGLPRDDAIEVPERHLGLHLAHEDVLGEGAIARLADLVEGHVDLEALLSAAAPLAAAAPPAVPHRRAPARARIGVVRDEAFCFYYEDGLDELVAAGAELVALRALDGELPDGLDGLYVGGGYPELHAARLAANRGLCEQIRAFAAAGGAIYGECGGLMYLSEGIEDLDGTRHQLCGVLPFWTRMTKRVTLAYAELRPLPPDGPFPLDQTIRGHTFHFSEVVGPSDVASAWEVATSGRESFREGAAQGRVVASYLHVHFASNPAFADAFVDYCSAGGRA